jgi:hypothetical protein
MRTITFVLRAIGVPMLAGCAFFAAAPGAVAQNADAQSKQMIVKPTDSDADAARQAKLVYRKAWSGSRTKAVEKSKLTYRAAGDEHGGLASREEADSNGNAGGNAGNNGHGNFIRFPGDLTYNGGAIVEFTESHDIYMLPKGSCPVATCWGNPERFLSDLGKSEFIHITDQYVGQRASNRYTLGQSASVSFTPSAKPLTDHDMQTVVHAVAAKTGQTGYAHIYHVFIPAGQDECFDSTFQICASNVFCAYHGSVDFQDIGHVLYSVEPYANVDGCQVKPGTPNGILVDSTNSILSHELIETITDPDGDAWWNSNAVGLFGEEIGDECQFVVFVPGHAYSDPVIINVHGRKYALQPEYSNRDHGCTAD